MNLQFFSEKTDELVDIVDEQFDKDKNSIDIEDTVLSESLKNQLPLQLIWEEIFREATWLVSSLEDESETAFSKAYIELSNDSHKALSTTDCKQYALSNPEYVAIRKVLNRAKLVKGRSEGVLDAIKTRRFILKNMCDIVIAGNENYMV